MKKQKIYRSIGLMSGTSLDGMDAALLETDGNVYVKPGRFISLSYSDRERECLRRALRKEDRAHPEVAEAEALITTLAGRAVSMLLEQAHMDSGTIDLIGFHGQTILHAPERRITVQIGDGAALARETRINVVCDFRSADVAAGGQGAPFLPLYHRALAQNGNIALPVAILNIGGVGNVTWIGGQSDDDMLAFDTGPGNALIDDLMHRRGLGRCDENGALARRGTPDMSLVRKWLEHPYFSQPAPKSLDRDAWVTGDLAVLSDTDAAATLTQFTVHSIVKATGLLPQPPKHWFVTGGGRHNGFMMECLAKALGAPVEPVERAGWNGDAMEAEGFAYLAVRSVLQQYLSLPLTTRVPAPQTGGVFYSAV